MNTGLSVVRRFAARLNGRPRGVQNLIAASVRRRLALLAVYLVVSLFALPVWAQGDGVTTLEFYSHPSERYNILVPPGWENLSDGGARLVNNALGATIDAFALRGDVETRIAEWAPEAIGAPNQELILTSNVQLTTGIWTQRLYHLPGSETPALTVFSQQIDGVEYVITFSTRDPVYAFVVPLESALADADGASEVIDAGLTAIGLDAQRVGDVTVEELGAAAWYRQVLRVGDEEYSALVRRSGELTADIVVGPSDAAAPEDAVVLTVVRDFFLTPDTTNFLALGLAASFLVLGGFITSLWVRARNLRRDEAALAQLVD